MRTTLTALLGTTCLLAGAACSEETSTPTSEPVICDRTSEAPYVRTETEDLGLTVWWGAPSLDGCLSIAYDPVGTPDIEGETEREMLRSAMATWNAASAACGVPACFLDGGEIPLADGLGYDPDGENHNLVHFVDSRASWRQAGHDPTAFGVTILTFVVSTGELRDTDIAINNWAFAYADPPNRRDGTNDLETVFVHELGHVLGFAHTGSEVESVMAPTLMPGDARRSLSDVDTAGLCETFACY